MSFTVERDFEIPVLVALLHRREKMLTPVFNPFDRALQTQRGGRDYDFLRIHDELGTEAAADIRRHDANLVLIAPQQSHQERPYLVRELRRGPQCQAVLIGVVQGQRTAAFDRVCAAAMLLEIDAGAVWRARKRGFDVAIALAKFDEEIAGFAAMRERGPRTQRGPTIRYRRKYFVIDVNQRGRIFRDRARLRDHDGNSLTDEDDFIFGQNDGADIRRQLVGAELQRQPLLRQHWRNISQRVYGVYARKPARRASVDTTNSGVRVRAAHEGRFQHARKLEIVDETASASKQRPILEPQHPFTDCVGLRHVGCRLGAGSVKYTLIDMIPSN